MLQPRKVGSRTRLPFTGAAGQFTLAFNAGTNTTTLLGDTDGNGVADFSILFTGNVTALTGTWVL